MQSKGDSGDEDTGGTVNNLSGKQLQATAEAKVTLAFQAQEDDKGMNKVVLFSIQEQPTHSVLRCLKLFESSPRVENKKRREDG